MFGRVNLPEQFYYARKKIIMSQTVPMTPEGYQKLQEELKHLMRVERPKVVQDIAEARLRFQSQWGMSP